MRFIAGTSSDSCACETAFSDPESFFHHFVGLSDEQAREVASSIWDSINGINCVRTSLRLARVRSSCSRKRLTIPCNECVFARSERRNIATHSILAWRELQNDRYAAHQEVNQEVNRQEVDGEEVDGEEDCRYQDHVLERDA